MTITVRQRVAAEGAGLVGRTEERSRLQAGLDDGGPLVSFVHGTGGVGKSALLDAFIADARSRGAVVILFDGGSVEPTPRGFLAALSAAIGDPCATIDDAAARLSERGDRVVLAIDRYEVMRPLDLWLQEAFVPALPDTVRVVLVGRDAPMPGWSLAMGSLFRPLRLDNLPREDARELLRRVGVAEADLDRVDRLAHGHPLSLRLAAAAMAAQPEAEHEAATVSAVVETLAERYLEGLDPPTRDALGAACVVRRPTLSLLAAMLPDTAPQDAFDSLRALPFVTLGADGLVIHDSVRDVVAAYLRASDPDRARRYRIAAWRRLRDELTRAGPDDLWRSTADLLYILENPMIREVFFPTTEHRYFVDEARPDDEANVLEIAARQLGPASTAIVEAWWQRSRTAFRVAREGSRKPAGFYVTGELSNLAGRLLELDPVARRWLDHLHAHPVPTGQRVIFDRFEIVGRPDDADAPLVTAAFMLDLKRTYLELRPSLRRIYSVDLQRIAGSPWERLEFQPLPGAPTTIDGTAWYTSVLDFGPTSVDGWLTRIIARELGVAEDSLLDVTQRQLVVDGRRVDLTRLEFEVFRCLYDRPGVVVDRASLLRDVWGYEEDGGSNVVDAQVKLLRRKLGPRADAIETVRGLGYRFVATA